MESPPVQYLERDGAQLAYQVFGSGPKNVVSLLEVAAHLDLLWTDPHFNHLWERSSSYSQNLLTQRRGIGVSDPIDYVPSLEQQAGDVLALMDEMGMARATLSSALTTCATAVLIAATHPERVDGLVMVNPVLQGPATTRPLLGLGRDEMNRFVESYRAAIERWGQGDTLPLLERALDTRFNRRVWAMLERCSASRDTMRASLEAVMNIDVTDLLGSIQAPARVLNTGSGVYPADLARAIAAALPHGSHRTLPVPAVGATAGEAFVPWIDEVQKLVTGTGRPADADRSLMSMLYTDVVDSTDLLAHIGDTAYRELRAAHERQIRFEVERHDGNLISVNGDGTLSLFASAGQAVQCAVAINAGAAALGIEVRSGVHTGEVDRSAADVSGLAMHFGARAGAAARAGEVLVSRTVRDVLLGSEFVFVSRGHFELKGIPGKWELYALDSGTTPSAVSSPSLSMTATDRATLRLARSAPAITRLGVRLGSRFQRRLARSVPRTQTGRASQSDEPRT